MCSNITTVFSGVTSSANTAIAGTAAAPKLLFTVNSQVMYAECIANCSGTQPTFQTAAVPAPGVAGAVLTDLQGGGVAVAATDSATNAVWYGECPSNCLSSTSWTLIQLPIGTTTVDSLPPSVAALGTMRGIAWGSGGVAHYAECSTGCTATTNWTSGVLGQAAYNGRAGLVFTTLDGGVERREKSLFGYNTCTGSCTGGGWSYFSLPSNETDVSLMTADLLPRIAGLEIVAPPNQAVYQECTSSDCGDGGTWINEPTGTASPVSDTSLGFAVDSQSRAIIVYNTGTNLTKLTEAAGATWASTSLACGSTTITGQHPSILLSSQDNLRVLYVSGTSVLYYVEGP